MLNENFEKEYNYRVVYDKKNDYKDFLCSISHTTKDNLFICYNDRCYNMLKFNWIINKISKPSHFKIDDLKCLLSHKYNLSERMTIPYICNHFNLPIPDLRNSETHSNFTHTIFNRLLNDFGKEEILSSMKSN